MTGGKLAYVWLPDTAGGGYTNFNRYYFAQLHKQGAIIEERFQRRRAGGRLHHRLPEESRSTATGQCATARTSANRSARFPVRR
jgi:tricorn protease